MDEITDLDELITLPKKDLMDMISIGISCFTDDKYSDEEVNNVSKEIILNYQINK